MKLRLSLIQLCAACVLAGAGAAAGAQTNSDATVAPAAAAKQAREISRGDPVRWYREDATGAERMRTGQKEIGAALDEAKKACRQGPAAERQACLKAAQDTWQKDMAALRAGAPVQAGSEGVKEVKVVEEAGKPAGEEVRK
jgi:predicted outer membrane protein